MRKAKVESSRGAPFTISRLPDGSVNVERKSSTLNFASKQDVARVFEQLYVSLYGETQGSAARIGDTELACPDWVG